jgi:hypothetical protein
MKKKTVKVSDVLAGKKKVTKKQSREEAELILEKGENFGDSLIGLFAMFAYDYKGLGAAAIGMAKALAALNDVARHFNVDIDDLYYSQLVYFEDLLAELPDLKKT